MNGLKTRNKSGQTETVAYYRVSTDRQGQSGLGLAAQEAAVKTFLNGEPTRTYTEIESGKGSNNRPELSKALADCKASGARLVVAKLDRLSRNVHFISGLMESKVDFVCVDFPEANKLTLHILAAVAEHEREAISERTRLALRAARKRGQLLGGQARSEEVNKRACAIARAARKPKPPKATREDVMRLRGQGLTWRQVGAALHISLSLAHTIGHGQVQGELQV